MKKDLFWAYSAQFLNFGSGIILIPIAVKFLNSNDMGLWYLFVTMLGLAQLLEFGFQPTISRLTSYVYSGANEIIAEGIPNKSETINLQLLRDLEHASKVLYRLVSIAAFIVLFVFGTIYLNTFAHFGEEQSIAWYLFVLSSVINFYFSYYNGLLIGRGEQDKQYKAMTLSKVSMLVISSLLLFCDVGLLSMSIGTLISSVIYRFVLKVYYKNSREQLEISFLSVRKRYLKTLWLSSYKLGITGLGAFLIQKSSFFIVSTYFGLTATASYGITMQLISILSSLSSMVFYVNLPKFNMMQGNGDKKYLRKYVPRMIYASISLYVIGACVMVLLGDRVLNLLSSNISLLSPDVFIVMLFIYILEMHHSLWAQYITTLNKVPFALVSIINGIATVSSSLILVNYFDGDMLGVVLCQGIVQLLFSNWYWPYMAMKELFDFNI